MPTHDSVEKQARKILDAIASKPFEECHPLNRKFGNIPARPGIYTIHHESIGLRQEPYVIIGIRVDHSLSN